MAKPMTPDQWLKALRDEGVTDIVEMPGWRTHNRNHKGPWGNVHASMIHHTAGEGPGLPGIVYHGVSGLPGPLCHDYLTRTGRVYLVGNGRANHAGKVAANAYDAVLHERSVHPAPGPDAIDGNAVSYGLEVENSGEPGRAWTAKQYDVAVRVQAARCRFHGWTANSVWAHKEATRRKPVDPRIGMDRFRADVDERLAHPASWSPGTSAPSPPQQQEDDMQMSDTVKIGGWIKARWPDLADGEISVNTALASGYAHSRAANENTAAIRRELAGLTAAVQALAAHIGSDDDTDTIVAAVRQEIRDAVVRVDVNVTGTPAT
jgi:hypothetical protein